MQRYIPLGDALTPDGSIKTGPFGTVLQAHEYSEVGVPLISVGEVREGFFELRPDTPRVAASTVKRLSQYVLQEGDVVFARKGGIERNAYVGPDQAGWFLGSDGLRARPGQAVNGRFLAFQLRTPRVAAWLHAHSTGSTMASLSQGILEHLPVWVPSLPEQQAIAEVLGALDDKIAANRALVATTLDLGSAICERAAQTGRSAQVADVAEFHNRKRIPLSARERSERLGSVPYWGANGQLGWVDEAIFDDNYVLIGEDGSVVTEQGTPVIHNLWGPAWVNNHAHVLSGKGISTDLLYFVLRRAHVADAVTGAVQPKLSMGKLKAVQIRLPDDSALPKVDARATSLLQQTRALEAESATLASLRDTLLPALMKGTIRVKDAEAAADKAL